MPPDAPQPPREAATDVPRDENDSHTSRDVRHDAANCAACRDGVQPWTPERRAAAAVYAARSGRRICDLPAERGEVAP